MSVLVKDGPYSGLYNALEKYMDPKKTTEFVPRLIFGDVPYKLKIQVLEQQGIPRYTYLFYLTPTNRDYSDINLLTFSVCGYPSCCGLSMFHEFYDYGYLTKEALGDFLRASMMDFPVYAGQNRFYNNRFVACFVESGCRDLYRNPYDDYTEQVKWRAYKEKKYEELSKIEWEQLPDTPIVYKSIYNFFKENAKSFKTLNISFNCNTRNLIHHVEFLL